MPTAPENDNGTKMARSCADFEAANCPELCSSLFGAPYDVDKQCLGAELAVACADTTGGCDGSITFAKAPDGRVLRFPSSCIPQGWSVIYLASDVDRKCPAQWCASFDAASCPEPCSTLIGAPYDAARQCLGAALEVACADTSGGCDDAETYAKAPDGRVLHFRDTCVPEGWSVIYLTSAVYRRCPEL
jgi:hypothetical protein